MNKCILFSLGLARAGDKKMKIMHLKQMVKYNKKAEAKARGGDRHKRAETEKETEKKKKNGKKNPSTLAVFSFLLLFFKKL